MELRHLRHLIALSEEGSFTKAAIRVHTVQSGLSASIKDLEQELGCRLVERTTRKVTFTGPGNLFLHHARETLAALDNGVKQLQSGQEIVKGHLRLGILQSLAPYVDLPFVLQKFRKAYPAVEISVRSLNTDTVPALVRSGEMDLSFHLIVDKSAWPGVQVLPFAQDDLVAVCSRQHEGLNSQKGVTLDRLSQEPFVDLTRERVLRRMVDKIFANERLARATSFEVSDIPTALQFVDRGLGVAIVPHALARSFAVTGRIAILELRSLVHSLPNWNVVMIRKTRQGAPSSQTITDVFLQILNEFDSFPKSSVYNKS